MRRDRQRVEDILLAAGRIEDIVQRGEEACRADHIATAALLHNLLIVGEAASQLTNQFRSSCPDVPWPKVVGLRNTIVHRYFSVDLDLVWNIVTEDLPVLKEALRRGS